MLLQVILSRFKGLFTDPNRPLRWFFRQFAYFPWLPPLPEVIFNSRGLFLGEIHKLGAIGRCFKPRIFFTSQSPIQRAVS